MAFLFIHSAHFNFVWFLLCQFLSDEWVLMVTLTGCWITLGHNLNLLFLFLIWSIIEIQTLQIWHDKFPLFVMRLEINLMTWKMLNSFQSNTSFQFSLHFFLENLNFQKPLETKNYNQWIVFIKTSKMRMCRPLWTFSLLNEQLSTI